METKYCVDCNTTKSIEEFYVLRRKGHPNTTQKICKVCDKKRQKEYRHPTQVVRAPIKYEHPCKYSQLFYTIDKIKNASA